MARPKSHTSERRCPRCGSDSLQRNGRTDGGLRQRWRCADCGHRTTRPVLGPPAIQFHSELPTSNRYVITSAQNATPVFAAFWEALLVYCEHVGAELIVVPNRYRNPTSVWTANNENDEWWAKEVVPYLYDGRFDLGGSLTILADVKVQPTAVSPLEGLEAITHHRSAIIGHPKVQLKTVATPQHKLPKILTTTGAVTKPNYSDTKTGKKGEFHHTYGATVVELDGDAFHLRQLNATARGEFIDLDLAVSQHGVKPAPPAAALVMGDTHVDFVDPAVVRATFTNPGSMAAVLRPEKLVWHDLLDFHSRSHHHRGNPIIAAAVHQAHRGNVRAEVERACSFVDEHSPEGVENVFVPSNHPAALGKWVRETDWRADPENAEFYLETALAMIQAAKLTPERGVETVDAFHYWARQLMNSTARFLEPGESCVIKGYEVGMHGHAGVNGARGSVRAFARIGTKSVTGHGHSPEIYEGARRVGTSSYLTRDWSVGGPSSWLQTHYVIYANGKGSLLNVIGGEWRLKET